MKITMEMNETHACIILKALDLFSRLSCGQLDELQYFLPLNESAPSYDDFRKTITRLKKDLFPQLERDASYSIMSSEAKGFPQIAFEILEVLRNKIAWHKFPEGGMTVNFHEPMKISDLEFPKVIID